MHYYSQVSGVNIALNNTQPDADNLSLKRQYERVEAENRALRSGYRLLIIMLLAAFGLLFIINVRLHSKQEQKRFLQAEIAEEKNHIILKKQQVESELTLSTEQAENQRELLFLYDSFLKFHVEQQLRLQKNANKIRSKYPKLADDYEKMLELGRDQFNELVNRHFTEEGTRKLFDIRDENNILTKNDRLLLFMLVNNAENEQIAALLNVSSYNLKSRKSYLKKKIIKQTTDSNGFERLIDLF